MNPYSLIPKVTGTEVVPVSFFMDNEENMILMAKFLAFMFLIIAVSY